MPSSSQYQPNDTTDLTATIASGQTTSGFVDMGGVDIFALFMPAAFTGTSVTFQTALTPTGTYVPVKDGAGNDYTVTVGANQCVIVPDTVVMAALRYVKLASNASEAAERVIHLMARPV